MISKIGLQTAAQIAMGFLRASMILIGVIPLIACNQKTSSNHPNTLSQEQVRLQETLKVGQDLQSQGCPANSKKTKKYVKNIHEPAITDVLVSTHCDGKVIAEYHANTFKPTKILPSDVRFFSAGRKVTDSVSIGDSRDALLKALGKPSIEDGRGIHYFIMDQENPGPDNTISFKTVNGKLTEVVWVWPVY